MLFRLDRDSSPALGMKVHGQIQLLQRLAALQVLDLGQVIDRYIQVLKLLQFSISGITEMKDLVCHWQVCCCLHLKLCGEQQLLNVSPSVCADSPGGR